MLPKNSAPICFPVTFQNSSQTPLLEMTRQINSSHSLITIGFLVAVQMSLIGIFLNDYWRVDLPDNSICCESIRIRRRDVGRRRINTAVREGAGRA